MTVTALRALIILTFISLAPSSDTYAQNNQGLSAESEIIADHYMVLFKDPAEGSELIVLPPNPDNKVPFGEHSSGQSKEALSDYLGLEGEVLKIFDAVNAIHILATENDVQSLSNNPNVAHIEPDSYVVQGDDDVVSEPTPERNELTFDGEFKLHLPNISFEGQSARYQDIVLQSVGSEAYWKLVSVKEGYLIPALSISELVVTNEIPAQVFLRLRILHNECTPVGIHTIEFDSEANVFSVSQFYDSENFNPGTICGTAGTYLSKTIPLPVLA